jgi:peptide-methionine (S)-S-oxide reductase
MKKETIVFGGGCFWCTEAVFKMLKGVFSVEPGYAGGSKSNPTYEDICTGTTGHAEVIKIEYDSQIIPLETLLTVFFASHDPTTKDRQGNDVGTQYRSIILCQSQEQKLLCLPAGRQATKPSQFEICKRFIENLNASSEKGAPIVTEVKLLETFYPAEDYHKNYYENNKNQGYCQVVINPKLKKVQEEFAKLLK